MSGDLSIGTGDDSRGGGESAAGYRSMSISRTWGFNNSNWEVVTLPSELSGPGTLEVVVEVPVPGPWDSNCEFRHVDAQQSLEVVTFPSVPVVTSECGESVGTGPCMVMVEPGVSLTAIGEVVLFHQYPWIQHWRCGEVIPVRLHGTGPGFQ